MSDAITRPLNQSQVAGLLDVSPSQLIKARQKLVKGENADWFQESGTNRILYTPQGLKALIQSGLGDPSLLQKLQPAGQIIHSPNQPLYREPELPRWEREPVETLLEMEPDHQIQPFATWGRNAEIEQLRQELAPVQYSDPASYPDTVRPPQGGIHGGSGGGVVIINGDVNYHRSSVRESPKRVVESGFSVTAKQQQALMFGMIGLLFFWGGFAIVNAFRPAVVIQERAPYEQPVR